MDELINLQRLFNEKLFRIPDYQRGYSWGTNQLQDFWDDLIALLPDKDHYTGMLSLKEVDINNNEKNQKGRDWTKEEWLSKAGYEIDEIVDGQQRLTTIIILIHVILTHCIANGIDYINNQSINRIRAKYIFEKKDNESIIKTYKFGYEVDDPSYDYFRIKILDDEDERSTVNETFYTLNLGNAKKFFEEKINELSKQGFSEIEELFNKLTLHLKFNVYKIKDDFNVYVAFETMNNRGKGLSYLELLKNRLIYISTLISEDNEENQDNKDEADVLRDNINKAWKEVYKYLGKDPDNPLNDDEFLRDHWLIYFGYQTRKDQKNSNIPYNDFLLKKYFIQQRINNPSPEILDSDIEIQEDDYSREQFEDEEYDESTSEEDEQPIETPNELLTYKVIQKYINSLKELIPFWYQTFTPIAIDNNEIAKYLSRLNVLNYANTRPLATVILSKSNIDDATKIECLKKIERFIFLYFRLDNYSTTYNSTVFYNLARNLYFNKIDIAEVLKTLNKEDKYYISANNVILPDAPIERFEKLMKKEGYYKWKPLKYLLYIYDLNKSSSISGQKINPDEYFQQDPKDKCSIEHIYPQTPKDKYWIEKFAGYSDDERRRLTGSLGNLLPLSLSLNKSYQNFPFKDKVNGNGNERKGYKNGSNSEREVADTYPDWNPESILDRGMKILNFMEDEFDFKFQDDSYRKRMLGLGFMIEEGDNNKHKTEPVIEEEDANIKERVFDESEYQKLYSITESDLTPYILSIHEYCLSMSKSSTVYTTPNYVGYLDKQVFLELHFHKDHLSLMLYHGEYDDPEGRTKVLSESYRWSKNVKLDVFPRENLNYIKHLIKQSYDHTMK